MGPMEGGVSQVPVWLDVDPGHDDAFAILLAAHHPSLELLGISTVHGNAPLTKTTNNALSVLEAIGKSSVPVFPGAAMPICREAHAAIDIHGESGLDGTTLLPRPARSAVGCNAIAEAYQSLMQCDPGTAWVVATGPLTNIALLFTTFPETIGHIRGLSIMGGSIGNDFTHVSLGPDFKDATGRTRSRIGNITPFAEFNIWCDPEAAQSIFRNRALARKTVLVPLDVTHQAFAGKKVQHMLLHGEDHLTGQPTKLRRMFNELLMFFAHTYADVFGLTEGPPLHDPLAVAAILAYHPDKGSQIDFANGSQNWTVSIELTGTEVGRTKITPSGDGVTIPRSLDLDKFWDVLEQCMKQADDATDRIV